MTTSPCDPCADNQPRAWSIRKGTYEMNAVFTGLAGELVAVLTQDKCGAASGFPCATLAVHDGQTAGGHLLMRRDFGCYIPGSLPAGIIADKLLVERMFADGAVTTAKLADNAVTSEKIADGAVTLTDLDPTAVASIVHTAVTEMQAGDKLSYLQLNDTPDSYDDGRAAISGPAGMRWSQRLYDNAHGCGVGLPAAPSTAFVSKVVDGDPLSPTGKKAAWFQDGSFANFGSVVEIATVRAAAAGWSFLRALTDAPPGNFDGGDVKFDVRGDGSVYADGAFTGGGADYAEWFRVGIGATLQPGQTVIWSRERGGVIPAQGGDKAAILGVVRDQQDPTLRPLIIGNQPIGSDRGAGWALIGLLGQMPILDGQPVDDRWISLYDNIWLVR